MDGHDRHDRLLGAFLAGEMDAAEACRWDEHLLECEQCWRAVREDRAGRQAAGLLRQPAPPGLADRVGLAVELAAAGPRSRHQARARVRPRWRWLAGAGTGTLAVGLAVTVIVLLLPGGRPGVPAAVAAVARYADAVSPPARPQEPGTDQRATPVAVGRPVTMTAGEQQIVVRTWRLGGVTAVVAVSGQPFAMPPGAQAASGGGMAWSVRLGKLALYCINGRASELVAAPVPAAELPGLVERLPPA
jgi:hypothetical protein